ncbi:hypothetical protein BYT27DRAFT_7227300 [Phlegmacium glaucopus]|nr:hypothetical protein BYT27DRAFT_7227300 [Phlegmacium glaucopus]
MPAPSHHSAPKFDGKATSLIRFLDEISQLGKTSGLSDKDLIEWTLRYAPSDDYELWSMMPAVKVTPPSWNDFKDELTKLYPGATGDRKYSVIDLELLAEKQATVPMKSQAQFGEYFRAFMKIAVFLKSKSRLTDREISNMFVQGFDYISQVRAQLRMESPGHHPDDPWALEEIAKAALFVLASHSEELRAIDVSIEGILNIEAVVDDGSQIINLRQDCWAKLGIPLRADHAIVMESANTSKNRTMGLLHDLRIIIGGYNFYVQAQVVRDAAYEMLIGRPFFTLTRATTQHFQNGDAHITLVDPNTHAVITIPTRSRNRIPSQDQKDF